MSILTEATQAEINEESKENLINDIKEDLKEEEQKQSYGKPNIDFGFLKAPTGQGSIEDYLDHVLNIDRSRALAQILRGFTGIAGNLNLAILDILLGIFAYLKDFKKDKKIELKNDRAQAQKPINETPIINP